MNLRRTLLTALLALGIVLGVAVPATASPATRLPGLQCGVNPTTDVRLRADLTCDQGFRGDAAVPVNIDLGGHTLTVINGTCTSFGRCGAIFDEASVTNGKVVGDLVDVRLVRKVRVTGSVYLNETTMDASVLERSTIRGSVGVLGPNATIRDNTIVGGGIEFNDGLNSLGNTQILDNRIQGAPGAGIDVRDELACLGCVDITATIAGNTIVGSGGDGIAVSGVLVTLGRIDITANTVRDSGGDGIGISTITGLPDDVGGPVTLTGNRLTHNGGHGVNSTWITSNPTVGVVDGGGNVARRNGLAPACIGVTCSSH